MHHETTGWAGVNGEHLLILVTLMLEYEGGGVGLGIFAFNGWAIGYQYINKPISTFSANFY